jgi:GntR family transcriptional regulator
LLRAEIQEGQRRPGSQLPTESEFQHEYGVSRTTVRAALATLASEGLVLTRKGFGSYVRSRPPLRRVSSTHRHASHRDSGKPEFDTEALAQGQTPSRRMLMTARGPVPGDIAAWLGVEAGEDAVIRKRLQLLDDVPAVISTSYYLYVPKTSSTSCDQAIFVDQGTNASLFSDAVLVEIDRLG